MTARDGQIVLDWPRHIIPIESVETIWRRDRSTRAGAAGAGITFAVLMGAVGFMATVFCLAEDEDCGGADILRFRRPDHRRRSDRSRPRRCRRRHPSPVAPRLSAAATRRRPPEERTPPRASGRSLSAPPLLGSLSLHLGGHADEAGRSARGGSGVRLRLSAELGPGLARYVWQRPDTDTTGLGRGQDSLGGSVGGGMRVRAGGPLWLGAEARWHAMFSRLSPLTSEGPAQRRNLWSLTTGTSLSW